MIKSLFDSLGVAAPVIIKGKFLLRVLNTESFDWDALLPDERFKE